MRCLRFPSIITYVNRQYSWLLGVTSNVERRHMGQAADDPLRSYVEDSVPNELPGNSTVISELSPYFRLLTDKEYIIMNHLTLSE